ncbi:MAG: DNA alkylation repair protein [Methylococcaceae bacterium]
MNPIKTELLKLANADKAIINAKFFKTAKGQYGEGDYFIGVTVPVIRSICKQFIKQTQLSDIETLLKDPVHEIRLAGVLMLVYQFEKASKETQKQLYEFYLVNTQSINNWDLVDSSAHFIVGCYLWDKSREELYKLANASCLWQQRIAIIATFYFIKRGQFDDTLKIAELFLNHPHDLIHKAVGWMLREIGKKDQAVLESFLKQHYQIMPRTMLRYAIEKFPDNLRKQYLCTGKTASN